MLRPCPEPSPAILELYDVVVTLATPSADDKKHNALDSYEYKGRTGKDEVACWVPVVPGSRFCIHVGYGGVSPPYPNAGLQFQVSIDGLGPLCSSFVSPKRIWKRIGQIAANKPVTAGDVELTGREMDNSIRPFCFYIRQTTDKEEDIPPPNLDSFGQVEVAVWWALEDPDIEDSNSKFDLSLLSNPINEKFKKVQHRCAGGLGQAEVDPDVGARISFATKPLQKEAFMFNFKYGDAEWFKAEKIIPRTTTKQKMARKSKSQPPAKRRKVTVKRENSGLKD
ncbi:hypothetical protein FRC08_000914 [Ceratobasidium sp. 394]|nr:hypothetical protein FRC08_000914 [Ceratobasidium sp. 394]